MAEKLAEAFVEVVAKSDKLKAGFAEIKSGMGSMVGGLLKAAAPLTAAFAAAFGIKKSIEAFAAAEKAENDLRQALLATGQEVEGNLTRFKDFATAVQKVTTIDDEAVVGLATYATNLGLTGDAVKTTVKAAIGLNKAFGVDQQTAIKQLTMEMEGIPTKLGKAIPALAGVTDPMERLRILSEESTKGFAEEMGSIGTLSGSWTQLKGQLENVGEIIGELIAGEGGSMLQWLTDWVIYLQEGLRVILEWKKGLIESFAEAAASGQGFIGGMASVFNSIKTFFQNMIKTAVFASMNFGEVWNAIVESFIAMVQTLIARAKNFGTNIVIIGKFFGDNWREIFTDIYEGAKTIFMNMIENIKSIFGGLWDWIKSGFTTDLNIDWTPLMAGFKSAVKNELKLEEFIGPDTDHTARDKLAKDFGEFMKIADEDAQAAAQRAKEAFAEALGPKEIDLNQIADKGKKKGEKTEAGKFGSLEDVFKNLNKSAVDEENKRQTALLKRNADAAERGADAAEETAEKVGVAE